MMDTSWNEGEKAHNRLVSCRRYGISILRYSNATGHVPEEPALAWPTMGEGLDQVAYRGPSQPILACDPMIYTTELVMTAQGE